MRPRHWIVLESGSLPLNRVAKPDYLRAQEMARQEIAQLRARGEWDSGYVHARTKRLINMRIAADNRAANAAAPASVACPRPVPQN